MKASYYKTLLLVLMCLGITGVHGEEHEWTNIQGKTIKAGFVSATNETVTISMQGKTYVVKLVSLSLQSRALAAKLRVQKLTAQKPVAKVEAPKIVVDVDQLEERDGLRYFEGEPFTGVAVRKYKSGQKRVEATFKDGKQHGLGTKWHETPAAATLVRWDERPPRLASDYTALLRESFEETRQDTDTGPLNVDALLDDPEFKRQIATHEIYRQIGSAWLEDFRTLPDAETFLQLMFADGYLLCEWLAAHENGTFVAGSIYTLFCIWKMDPTIVEHPVYSKLALAFAINGGGKAYQRGVAKRRSYVEWYRGYRRNHANGRLHDDFGKMTVIDMRQAIYSGGHANYSAGNGMGGLFPAKADLEYFVSERHASRASYPAACWAVPYRGHNLFGWSIQHPGYYTPWAHRWPAARMHKAVGGVCGALSKFGTYSSRAHGIPAVTAGQPGHCAYLVEIADDRWTIGNNVGGGTSPQGTFWTNSMAYVNLKGPALANHREVGRAWELYWFAMVHRVSRAGLLGSKPTGNAIAKLPLKPIEETYVHAALAKAPMHIGMWRSYANMLKLAEDTPVQPWLSFSERAAKSFSSHPGPGWDLINGYATPAIKTISGPSKLAENFITCHRLLPSWGYLTKQTHQFSAGRERFDVFTQLLNVYAGTPEYFKLIQANVAYANDPVVKADYMALTQSAANEENITQMLTTLTNLAISAAQKKDHVAYQDIRRMATGKLSTDALLKRIHFYSGQLLKYPKLPEMKGTLVSDRAIVQISSRSARHDRPLYGHQRLGLGNGTVGWAMTNPELNPWCLLTLPNFVNVTGVTIVTRFEIGVKTTPTPLELLISADGKTWTSVTTFSEYKPVLSFTWQDDLPRVQYVKLIAHFGEKKKSLELRNVLIHGNPEY